VHRDAAADRRRQDFHLQSCATGVKFHDGTPLTSADVKASWDSIIHPQEGVLSPRESYYMMVDKVEAPRPRRRSSSGSNSPPAPSCRRSPTRSPSSTRRAKLDKDPHWYEKNILGSGPFKFVSYETGQFDHRGAQPGLLPLGVALSLDGFTGIYAAKQGDPARRDPQRPRPAAEFRGLPPSGARRNLKAALGDKITVQESDWNCGKPGDAEPRQEAVRRRSGAPRP